MKPAAALFVAAAGALLVASHRTTAGNVEAADGDMGTLDPSAALDSVMQLFNQATEEPATVDQGSALLNQTAFLAMIRKAEGTDNEADPYRVCYGFRHTVEDLSNHPCITGEWMGETLPDSLCANAGFGPGCKSTAAGAYQFIKPTWLGLQRKLGLPDFGPMSQDRAALQRIADAGALQDVLAGRVPQAVRKVRAVWASLPGNYAKQGQRDITQLAAWFEQAGGTLV